MYIFFFNPLGPSNKGGGGYSPPRTKIHTPRTSRENFLYYFFIFSWYLST